jgi:hypothetical protein
MFGLYFHFRMFDLAGLKCEPGFGELISSAGDATVSARVYRSKGVTGTRHQTQHSPFIDVAEAWYRGPWARAVSGWKRPLGRFFFYYPRCIRWFTVG